MSWSSGPKRLERVGDSRFDRFGTSLIKGGIRLLNAALARDAGPGVILALRSVVVIHISWPMLWDAFRSSTTRFVSRASTRGRNILHTKVGADSSSVALSQTPNRHFLLKATMFSVGQNTSRDQFLRTTMTLARRIEILWKSRSTQSSTVPTKTGLMPAGFAGVKQPVGKGSSVSTIHSLGDFRKQVPVSDYQRLPRISILSLPGDLGA